MLIISIVNNNTRLYCLLQEAEEVFATTLDDLEREAKDKNIEIFNRQIFKDDPSAAVASLKRQVLLPLFLKDQKGGGKRPVDCP